MKLIVNKTPLTDNASPRLSIFIIKALSTGIII